MDLNFVEIGKYYFLILLLVPILIISAPSALAAEVIVQNALGSSIPGCEETNQCFIPYQVRINVGDTVTWLNDDTAAHTATSGNGADGPSGVFDSSLVMAGSSFSFTFEEAGTYEYFCMVHPWMEGFVIVSGSSLPPTTAEPTPTPIIPEPSPVSTNFVKVTSGSSVPGCEQRYQCHSPYAITVEPGTTVTWTNVDSTHHTVTSGTPTNGPDGIFDSSLFGPGRGFSQTFYRSGTFDYFCMIHPWAIGKVFVTSGPVPSPSPIPTLSLSVFTDSASYLLGNLVNVDIKLSGSSSGNNVAISVNDPSGNNVVSRTITTDSRGSGDISFKLTDSAMTGSYNVVATALVGGQTYLDTTVFKVESLRGGISIISLQSTDQQGNPVSSFSKGKLGFVKVIVSAESSISSLVTVNLFDSDLTSLGIGSFKTTLTPGQSEMVLSFFILNDAVSGTANIYANAFSDWPSQGGTPLTGESATSVTIR